ncbi:MAG: hypothetical protein ABIJ08_02725 [Nanoarchaeota archaeon]
MKKWLIILIVIVGLIIGFNYYSDYSFNKRYQEAEYCYSSDFGRLTYHDGDKHIPNKKCVCEGELISSKCPMGADCDGAEFKCYGKIDGFKYGLSQYIEDVFYDKEFDSLEEYEKFCYSLTEKAKDRCIININVTRTAEKGELSVQKKKRTCNDVESNDIGLTFELSYCNGDMCIVDSKEECEKIDVVNDYLEAEKDGEADCEWEIAGAERRCTPNKWI